MQSNYRSAKIYEMQTIRESEINKIDPQTHRMQLAYKITNRKWFLVIGLVDLFLGLPQDYL